MSSPQVSTSFSSHFLQESITGGIFDVPTGLGFDTEVVSAVRTICEEPVTTTPEAPTTVTEPVTTAEPNRKSRHLVECC